MLDQVGAMTCLYVVKKSERLFSRRRRGRELAYLGVASVIGCLVRLGCTKTDSAITALTVPWGKK